MKNIILICILAFSKTTLAGSPIIEKAETRLKTNQLYDVIVTLKHADTGWDHYADEWVVEVDGEIIATRTLHHPHVDEQPFTRSLRNVNIPRDAKSVKIYAKCNKEHRSQAYVLLNNE